MQVFDRWQQNCISEVSIFVLLSPESSRYYELALEAPWRGSKTVSVSDWLIGESGESAAGASWSAQRCGTRFGSASATEAWALLLKTVFVVSLRSRPENCDHSTQGKHLTDSLC